MRVRIIDRTAQKYSTFNLMEEYYHGCADYGCGNYVIRYWSRIQKPIQSW